jgi:energy-coupling factor transport system permease protein
MHPAAWILWATFAGFVAFSTTNPVYLVPLVVVAWFVYACCGQTGPNSRSFRAFLSFGIVAMAVRTALVLFGTVNASNVAYAFLEGLRLATLLVVFGTFNAVADPFAVLRLAPRRFHEPALAAALALSLAPRTVEAAGRVREAQELRGIRVARWRSLAALAVPVLETGMEEAVTLAESMDARGHGRGPRTRYRPQPWSLAAVATIVAAASAAAAFVTASFLGLGGLHPTTAPLGWPQGSPALVGALCLLAAPGLVARGPAGNEGAREETREGGA